MTIRTLRRGLIALALGAAAFVADAAHAVVPMRPLAMLQTIFDQPNVLSQRRLLINILSPQRIAGPRRNVDAADLLYLTRKSGFERSRTIPLFYIDSFASSTVRGLGFLNDNGVALLSSYQADLEIRPRTRVPVPCPGGGSGCFAILPPVTADDIPRGWLASAEVIAHEIGHNLNLQHTLERGLMNPVSTPYHAQNGIESHLLRPNEVTEMFRSRLINYDDFTSPSITLAPFLVVPEPGTWALLIIGFGMTGATLRRRRAFA